MKHLITSFLLACMPIVAGFTQGNYSIEHFSIDDGLPDREVTAVIQDDHGFVWVGTNHGISRFDGYDFVNFNSENTKAITDNRITALLIVEGVLWAGTQSNLLMLNLKTYEWQVHKKIGAALKLFLDSKSQIWVVGSDDEVYCVLKNGMLRKIEETQPPASWVRSPVNTVMTMGEGAGGVWWGRLDGTLRQYSEKKGIVNLIFDGNQFEKRGSVFLDKDSLVWHSTNYYLKLYHVNGQEVPIDHNVEGLTRAGTMTALPNGSILLTDLENRILKINSSELNTVIQEKLSAKLSTTRAINSLFSDGNLLWLATNSGLYKANLQSSHFNKILEYDNGLNSIRYIAEFEGQKMMVSAYTGLYFLNKKNEVDSAIYNPFYVFYKMLPKANNTYWVASEGTGLLEFNSKDRTIKHLTYNHDSGGHPARYLTSLEEIDNLLFIGEYTGLYYYHKSTGLMEEVKNENGEPSLIGERINDLHIDNDGVLWIACNKGVYVLDISTGNCRRWEFVNIGGNSYEVRVIFETSDNKLWFGTKELGLLMLDEQRKEVKQWKRQDGLVFDAINTITTSDNDRYLWISTDFGLSQFDRNTSTFSNYYQKDGISNNEFNKNAVLKHSDGSIYMGGINGVNIFNPSQLTKEIVNAKMMLTAFSKYDGEQREVIVLKEALGNEQVFNFSPYDRLFKFKFVLNDFTDPDKNRYKYKIDGIHKDWVHLGNQHELMLDNLSVGTHILKVKGTNGKGHWSEEDLQLTLVVHQLFYKTGWFIALVVLFVLFLAWTAHKIRVNQLLKLERMRTRIARDLHDELGSSLTRISMYSELAKSDSGQDEKLDQLSELSKEAASTLSDIVWSIDNENDTLDELVGRMKDHLALMLDPLGINWKFELNDLKEDVTVNAEAKQHLFLIYKEAINNIVKHAQASKVSVSIFRTNALVNMVIKNDGIFEKYSENKVTKGGKGTKSMEARSNYLKGELHIEKSKNSFRLKVIFPFKSL